MSDHGKKFRKAVKRDMRDSLSNLQSYCDEAHAAAISGNVEGCASALKKAASEANFWLNCDWSIQTSLEVECE